MTAPRYWYNIAADLPALRGSYLDPVTRRPLASADLTDIFPAELAEQELATDHAWVPIPEPVREAYERWRPSPLRRAVALERQLGTKCRIYYKYEGSSPIGSHKANSGIAQAHYARRAGARRVVAETGAGQWGTAISMGAAFQNLDCEVFMVRNSYDSKPGRRLFMQSFGASIHPSPSPLTAVGRAELERDPETPGSLGLAIAEAVESARSDPKTYYSLGSAFNFVCLHQTVIGLELADQLAEIDVEADLLISCIGGGSSFAGLVFPMVGLAGTGRRTPECLAVESNAVPTATAGQYAYDHGDSARLTPLSLMYTLGHTFAPPGIHSGGLRYHGLSPMVSAFLHEGYGRAIAIPQLEVFGAALAFTRAEGIIPAPESAHSIAAAIRVATERKNENLSIVFLLTGHGHFDMSAYGLYLGGGMEESATPEASISESLRKSLAATSGKAVAENGYPTAAVPPASTVRKGAEERQLPGSGGPSFQNWWKRHFAEPDAGGETGLNNPSNSAGTATLVSSGQPLLPVGASATAPAQELVDLSMVSVVTARVIADRVAADRCRVRLASTAVVTPLAEEELHRRAIEVSRDAR